jgi:hypothetical protein
MPGMLASRSDREKQFTENSNLQYVSYPHRVHVQNVADSFIADLYWTSDKISERGI